jgi:hypothetical protein
MGQMGWPGFHVVCEENVVRAHLLVVFHMKPSLFGYYEHICPYVKQNEGFHFYIIFYRSPFENTFRENLHVLLFPWSHSLQENIIHSLVFLYFSISKPMNVAVTDEHRACTFVG